MINKRLSFVVVFLVLITFVLAAASAPTGLIFNNNATSSYDEGSFFVNWTSGGGGDAEANYSIYLFSNDSFYLKADNDSIIGYSFSNTTEANYTFIIEAMNKTGDAINSSANISIYVDSTPPTIILPHYTNSTIKNNTETLTLNISISDSLSGLTGGFCLVDVNGTNQTIPISGEWCNSSSLALTGLSEGTQLIRVYANDSVNNFGLNNSYTVLIDNTAPSPSGLTLSGSSRTSLIITFSGAEGTCSASGSGTKAISGSTLTVTELSCSSTYAYTITCVDSAGNSGTSSSTSFSTLNCISGTSVPQFWSRTFVISESQFASGFTGELSQKERFKLKINEEDHYIGIIGITGTTAKINVSSTPQQVILEIGESSKFDVTEDGFYDIWITLNSIDSNKADITVVSISEEIEIEKETKETADSEESEIPETEEKNLIWLWILIILIVVAGILYIFKNKSFWKKR